MTQPWWRSSVVYQVYPRSFADSNGDGIGDLPGLVGRLDHIRELGADIVWVSPFYPSPQADNGYDVSDYEGVDPLFGTLADVDRLIAELHARGMKLVLDIVVNHTSEEHPWFVESRSNTTNPKRDWYWWRPARAGLAVGEPGAEPTDWQSFFSGSVWEPDPTTDAYYLHLFARQQPDLNWENPDVRAAVHAMLRWWLDRGVDGFRFDVVNLVSKQLNDDGAGWFFSGPRIHEFLHEMHEQSWAGREIASGGAMFTVGETPGATVEQARAFTDPARAEVDMVFQFEHMSVDHGPGGRYDPRPVDWVRMKEVMSRWQTGLADTGWNSLYWCNHDQPRPVSRYGAGADPAYPGHRELSAKALATVLHLHCGTPYVYQGEELGMANYPFTDLAQLDDVESRNWSRAAIAGGLDPARALAVVNVAGRDHARTPMQWDGSSHAGFTTGTPWLLVNPDHIRINAAAQRRDPDSVFAHYQRLIRLRRELPVVVDGDFELLLPDHPRVYAFTRRLGDEALLVVANLGSELVTVPLPQSFAAARVIVASGMPSPDSRAWGELGPWEARVHHRA